jgi:hypothetical protein
MAAPLSLPHVEIISARSAQTDRGRRSTSQTIVRPSPAGRCDAGLKSFKG